MKLIKAKLRGTGPVIESNWFQLSTHLNQFHFPSPQKGTAFLRALQTLQPPFSCRQTDPFVALPRYEKKEGHTRHIQAGKRTIALGVFTTTTKTVTELGLLDNNLYEADRIEIGRRLDYSRWLNFVELSSSTRWQEIKAAIIELLRPMEQIDLKRYSEAISFTSAIKTVDRIKDGLADKLLFHLRDLKIQQSNDTLYEEVTRLIRRAEHFQAARKLVFQRLPLFIYFNEQGDINHPLLTPATPTGEDHLELRHYIEQQAIKIGPIHSRLPPQTVLEKLKSGIQLSLLVSKELQRTDPIFLFDAPDTNIHQDQHDQLRQLLTHTAKSKQCLYLCHEKRFFQQQETGEDYSYEELKRAGE